MELEEIRKFIGAHEPFTRLDAAQRGRAAKSVQIEYFRCGSVIIEMGVANE
jgi:signal-transduction protein with cAMP-binding, CBS, and nucleotidyltransferase domain